MQRLFRLFGALSEDTTPCGKPLSMAHAHALHLLAQGERSQQELGLELHIDKSNVARLCGKMADMGHVVQTQSPRDKRSRLVKLTPKGARLASEVGEGSLKRFRQLLEGIPVAEQASALDGLRHIVASLDESSKERKQ